MFVIDADQRESRSSVDRVPAALKRVAALASDPEIDDHPLALPPERTVGDEFQCLLTSASAVITITRELIRMNDWYVGIGVGRVETPLPDTVRSARGEAFIFGREAVENAKLQRPPVEFISHDPIRAQEIAAYFRLLATLWMSRTDAGWTAVDAMEGEGGFIPTMSEVAPKLGITRQALGQRLQAAEWKVEREAIPLLERLLIEADRD